MTAQSTQLIASSKERRASRAGSRVSRTSGGVRPETTHAAARGATRSLAHYIATPAARVAPLAFTVFVVLALYTGWSNRHEGHLTPESGTGYWLGIIGATMMLLLMVYPLRKRLRWLRVLGSVPGWFKLHMMFGVLGPLLVIFHTNFGVDSLNSTVSLVAMLTVVASGLVGRFLYARVHNGLYGSKSLLTEIMRDIDALRSALGDDLSGTNSILEELRAFETRLARPDSGVWSSFGQALIVGARSRLARRRLIALAKHSIAKQAAANAWNRRQRRQLNRRVRSNLDLYFGAARKAARFYLFERLFALWHVLHLPLFVLLVLTTLIHVIAVHLY